MSELPEGWVATSLGDLCSAPQYGWTTSARKGGSGGLRFLRTTDITHGRVNWSTVPYCADEPAKAEQYALAPGDIVISRAGSVGFSHRIIDVEPSVFASYLIRFRPSPELDGRYLAYFLQAPAYWRQIKAATSGITLANVNAKKLAAVELPVAPRAEQTRIVAAIEEQFSRLDAGVAALDQIRRNLRRMRAAILEAAVTGKLVDSDGADEPSCHLMERISSQRRKYLQQHPHAGSKREPVQGATRNLPTLPATWCWGTVDQICTRVVDGVHKKPAYVASGIPFVTVRNLTAGPGISFDNLRFVSEEDHESFIRRAHPEQGDLLLSKDGTLGVVRAIRTGSEFSIFVSVALLKPVDREMTDYLELALSSPVVQRQMVAKGSGLQHIHLEDLRRDCIPIPPLAEQRRIADEAHRQLSLVTKTEIELASWTARVRTLRSSILTSAFSGDLVAQDLTEETASSLLERIVADRGVVKVEKVVRTPARASPTP